MSRSAEALSPEFEQFVTDRIGWIFVDNDLLIQRWSENVSELIQTDMRDKRGVRLSDVFQAFIGIDDVLHGILGGESSNFVLERINIGEGNEFREYVDVKVSRFDNERRHAGLIVIIEKTTSFGRLEQILVQERNELRLAQRRLAAANAELRRLDNLKTLFLSMAAHDLRSPLAVIRGYADLLLSDLVAVDASAENDPLTQESLATIKVHGDWLDTIISNILDLDRFERGELVVNKRPLEIVDCAQSMVDLMQDMARLNRHTLACSPQIESAMIAADEPRIRQVLQNIIGNAIKYSPSGIQIDVSVWVEGARAIIEVRDNGRGIPAEQMPHIFELYYRVKGSDERKVRGSGLGLYICKTIVEAHGGTLSAESEVGVGSIFRIEIPILTTP